MSWTLAWIIDSGRMVETLTTPQRRIICTLVYSWKKAANTIVCPPRRKNDDLSRNDTSSDEIKTTTILNMNGQLQMDLLPEDVCHLVASFLSLEDLIRASRVCRKWHGIMWQRSWRRRLDFSTIKNGDDPKRWDVMSLIAHFKSLHSISFKVSHPCSLIYRLMCCWQKFGPANVGAAVLDKLTTMGTYNGNVWDPAVLRELSLEGCRKVSACSIFVEILSS